MTTSEDDPGAAVRDAIDCLVSNGLRDWVYAVESVEDDEVLGYFNGFGVEVDLEELIQQQADQVEVRDPEDIRVPLPPASSEDAQLIKLAEELNRQ